MKNIIQILAIILLIAFLHACGEEQKTAKIPLRPLQYTQVKTIGSNKIRTFSGTSKTDRVIKLSFRSNGIITLFDIKLGQKVTKGQLLAKLDNVQARLNYENSITSKNSAESQMNTAKLTYDRTRKLFEKGGASLSDFESAKNSFKTAQQSYQSAGRSVEIQKDQIEYGFLYAPVDGLISAVNTEIDENINAGFVVATLNSGKGMEISLGIPESVINGIIKGMQADVTFSSIINKQFSASVSEISPVIDNNTSTYPVTLLVAQQSSLIKSGMTANITFNFEKQIGSSDKIIVPTQSVGEDSNGQYVFVVNINENTGVVNKQKITIGELTADGFEVINGLQVGQYIATAGLLTLLDGQKVKIP